MQQEVEERGKREERGSIRAEATQRFTAGLQQRESLLQEAEERVAQRQSTLAELKRAQLEVRAEEAVQRQQRVAEARINMRRELQKHTAHTEGQIRKKTMQVENFRQRQREEREAAIEKRPESTTPRGNASSTPRSAATTTPRRIGSKGHDGISGLELPLLRCSLCEQQFSSLSGATFLKAVATQRATFGDDELLRWCERRGLLKMYESANLCVFCCQFFQERWHAKEA